MKEIFKNIYTFEVTLPNSPLKFINSYIIKGKDKTLLIDTGYNRTETKSDLLAGLRELNVELKDISLIITHLHADHTGLVNLFSDAGCKVYVSKTDGEFINSMVSDDYWNMMNGFKQLYGVDEDEMTIADNPGYNFKLEHTVEFDELKIGEIIEIANFKFEVIDLKGHTPGHIGLYDKEHKILFGADTVLDPITPNITFWGFKYPDILGTYVNTLLKLKTLNLDYIFSSHRKIIDNPTERIEQLLEHHKNRLQEILTVMDRNREYTVKEISSKITWRIRANNWDEFPKPQKWFATGETMSHMEHMVYTGHLTMVNKNGVLYFKKEKDTIENIFTK